MTALLILIHGAFSTNPNAAGRNYQFPVLIPILGHGLREDQFARTSTFFFPGLARLHRCRQDIPRFEMAVIREVLFGMETTTATTTAATAAALHARGFLTRAKPGLPDSGLQRIVGIKLGTGDHKGRRGNDGPRLGGLGIVSVRINLVVVANGPGEQHDVARLDGKFFYCHSCLSLSDVFLWTSGDLIVAPPAIEFCCREHTSASVLLQAFRHRHGDTERGKAHSLSCARPD